MALLPNDPDLPLLGPASFIQSTYTDARGLAARSSAAQSAMAMTIPLRVMLYRCILAVTPLLLLLGCTESDVLVERDEDAPPQVLIVSRDIAGDPRGDSEEAAAQFPPSADVDPMRLLWVQTYETEYADYTYESARASFWAATDDSGSSASFQRVRLGGHDLPLLDPDCMSDVQQADGDLCWVIRMNDRPLNVFSGDAGIGSFTDRPLFEASGDPHLQDVVVRPDIPPSYRMKDVRPGTRVDATRSWTIDLELTVDSPAIFIRSEEDGNDDSHTYKTSSEKNLFVSVDGMADKIVIPQSELERLYAAGARDLWVSLYVNPARNRVDVLSIDARDAGPPLEIGVAMSSFHNVWNVELVK